MCLRALTADRGKDAIEMREARAIVRRVAPARSMREPT
jgi:hypothetical protein